MAAPAHSREVAGLRLAVLVGLLAISVALGQWYLRLALRALFVFRADEPLVRLLALAAPAYLVPGGILASLKPKAGGAALLVIGLISGIGALPAMDFSGPSIGHYWLFFALPVCLIGAGFWVVGKFLR